MGNEHRTINRYLDFMRPGLSRRKTPLAWPPDMFAVAAFLLLRSGGYLYPARRWPPASARNSGNGRSLREWVARIEETGREWRRLWPHDVPDDVQHWWSVVREHGKLPISGVRDADLLCEALIQILAAADEASSGLGFPAARHIGAEAPSATANPAFADQARLNLAGGGAVEDESTLCSDVSVVRVLPKAHTPQSGISLRSLSHHLALWTGDDVDASWANIPELAWQGSEPEARHSISLLLVPWPKVIQPKQFGEVEQGTLPDVQMPPHYRFFSYDAPSNPRQVQQDFIRLYEAAEDLCGPIDGVVFPELALTEGEYAQVWRSAAARGSFLISGIGARKSGISRNFVRTQIPIFGDSYVRWEQGKHHRWMLDRHQIVQYGLGARLDPEVSWWEETDIGKRRVDFLAMFPWLSMCTLICEDLARQDPVARLVRCVGPNLVIALLMDGPQLAQRWPARYATVLAEDPGSSVLTLTSLGMCSLSRPPNCGPLRTVAMWKDALSASPLSIDLPEGADGIVLHLVRRYQREYTADGRDDVLGAGYPTLAGVHPVRVPRDDKR